MHPFGRFNSSTSRNSTSSSSQQSVEGFSRSTRTPDVPDNVSTQRASQLYATQPQFAPRRGLALPQSMDEVGGPREASTGPEALSPAIDAVSQHSQRASSSPGASHPSSVRGASAQAEAQQIDPRKQEKAHLLASVEKYLRNEKKDGHWLRKREEVGKFIDFAHRTTSILSAGLSTGKMDYAQFMQLHAAYFAKHPTRNTVNHRASIDGLIDVLFAQDLRALIGPFKNYFLDAKRRGEWQAHLSDAEIDARIKDTIGDVFKLNRVMLTSGTTLTDTLSKVNREDREAVQTAWTQIFAPTINKANLQFSRLNDFFAFWLDGPEQYRKTPPPVARRAEEGTASASPGAPSRIAAVAKETKWRSDVKKKGSAGNAARVLPSSNVIQLQPNRDIPERVEVRCLGQGGGRAPYYQEKQTNLNCGAHALNSFLLGAYDIERAPLPLTLQRFLEKKQQALEEAERLGQEPLDDAELSLNVLIAMGAKNAPVTMELLQHVTEDLLPPPEETESQLTRGTEQIHRYLEVIGKSPRMLQITQARDKLRSSEWPYLKQLIDQAGNTRQRLILSYTAQGAGHHLAFHRDPATREWTMVDSKNYEPGSWAQPKKSPSEVVERIIRNYGVQSFEILVDDEQRADENPDTRQAHDAMADYQRSIQAKPMKDAADALSTLSSEPISALALDRFIRDRKAQDPSAGPSNDAEHIAAFINKAFAGVVENPAMTYREAWKDQDRVVDALDTLASSGVAILSGLPKPPFHAAVRDCGGEWKVIDGNGYRDLDSLFEGMGEHLTPGYPIQIVAIDEAIHTNGIGEQGSASMQVLGHFGQEWREKAIGELAHSEQRRRTEAGLQARVRAASVQRPRGDSQPVAPRPPQIRVTSVERDDANVFTEAAQRVQPSQHVVADVSAGQAGAGHPAYGQSEPDDELSRTLAAALLTQGNDERHGTVTAQAPASGDVEEQQELDEATIERRLLAALLGELERDSQQESSLGADSTPTHQPSPMQDSPGGDEGGVAGVSGALQTTAQDARPAYGLALPTGRSDTNEDGLAEGAALPASRPQMTQSARRFMALFDGERPTLPTRKFRRPDIARAHRQHVQDKPIFRAAYLVEGMRRNDYVKELDDDLADAILDEFRMLAETDPRFGSFQSKQDLLDAIDIGIHPDNAVPARGIPGQILRFVTAMRVEDENGSIVMRDLPLLIRIRVDHQNKRIHIAEMWKSSADNLKAMQQRLGPLRYRTRTLNVRRAVVKTTLQRARDADNPLATLRSKEELLATVREGLSREGDQRPIRLRPQLWRVIVRIEGEDVPILVRLRQNNIEDVRLYNEDNRFEMLDAAKVREQRQKEIFQRIALHDAQSGALLQRLMQHLTESGDGRRFSLYDTIHAVAQSDDLEQLEGADYPLKRLEVETASGETLAYVALFEDGELIDLRRDIPENRHDMRRLQVSYDVSERLKGLLEQLPHIAAENNDGTGLNELVAALATHAGDANPNLKEVLQNLLRRGTGTRIDPDYPNIKRYEIDLVDAEGELIPTPLLVRLNADKRIEEILPDTPENRDRIRPFHFDRLDKPRVFGLDKKNGDALKQLAVRDHQNNLPEGEEGVADPDEIKLSHFITKVVARNKGEPIHEAYPEIARYDTGLRDPRGKKIYLLARVRNSAIIDVRVSNLGNFLNMVAHKSDPGDFLPQVQAELGDRFTDDFLRQVIHPDRQQDEPIHPAFPAIHGYDIEEDGLGNVLLGRVEDRVVLEIATDTAQNRARLATYKIPVARAAHIATMDVRHGRFLQLNKAPGQNLWEFILANVTHDRRQEVPGWPQLGTYEVDTPAGRISVLARVENGEIWDVREDTNENRQKLQKDIRRDLLREGRRIAHVENRRLEKENVDHVIRTLQAHQARMEDPELRAEMLRADFERTARRIAAREHFVQMGRLAAPPEIRSSMPSSMADLDLPGGVFDMVDRFIHDEDWEPVEGHPDIRRYDTGLREENQPVYLYAYMDDDYLVDMRTGTEEALERLTQTRSDMLKQVPDVAGTYLSRKEIQEIYMRDRHLRNGALMALADRADVTEHRTFVQFLSETIPAPRFEDGRFRFEKGIPVLSSSGSSSELFRRYPTGMFDTDGREIELFALFKTDRPLDDPEAKITLQDVWVAPPPQPQENEGYQLSHSLLAQIRFLRRIAEDEATASQDGDHDDRVSQAGDSPLFVNDPNSGSHEPDNAGDGSDDMSWFDELPPLFPELENWGFSGADAGALENTDVPMGVANTANDAQGATANAANVAGDTNADDLFQWMNEFGALFPEVQDRTGWMDGFDNPNHFNQIAAYRVEITYDDPEINRFMNDLYSNHGPRTFERFAALLAPQGNLKSFDKNFARLISALAQPDKAELLSQDYPELKVFKTELIDDFGKPVSFFSKVNEDKMSVPLIDTEENEKKMLAEVKDKAASAMAIDTNDSAADTTMVDVGDLPRVAIGRQALEEIVDQLLSDPVGIKLINIAYARVRRKDSAVGDIALANFLENVIQGALQEGPHKAGKLTISTGVFDNAGNELKLATWIGKGRIGKIWIDREVERERRQRVDLEAQEKEWDRIIGKIPNVRKRARVEVHTEGPAERGTRTKLDSNRLKRPDAPTDAASPAKRMRSGTTSPQQQAMEAELESDHAMADAFSPLAHQDEMAIDPPDPVDHTKETQENLPTMEVTEASPQVVPATVRNTSDDSDDEDDLPLQVLRQRKQEKATAAYTQGAAQEATDASPAISRSSSPLSDAPSDSEAGGAYAPSVHANSSDSEDSDSEDDLPLIKRTGKTQQRTATAPESKVPAVQTVASAEASSSTHPPAPAVVDEGEESDSSLSSLSDAEFPDEEPDTTLQNKTQVKVESDPEPVALSNNNVSDWIIAKREQVKGNLPKEQLLTLMEYNELSLEEFASRSGIPQPTLSHLFQTKKPSAFSDALAKRINTFIENMGDKVKRGVRKSQWKGSTKGLFFVPPGFKGIETVAIKGNALESYRAAVSGNLPKEKIFELLRLNDMTPRELAHKIGFGDHAISEVLNKPNLAVSPAIAGALNQLRETEELDEEELKPGEPIRKSAKLRWPRSLGLMITSAEWKAASSVTTYRPKSQINQLEEYNADKPRRLLSKMLGWGDGGLNKLISTGSPNSNGATVGRHYWVTKKDKDNFNAAIRGMPKGKVVYGKKSSEVSGNTKDTIFLPEGFSLITHDEWVEDLMKTQDLPRERLRLLEDWNKPLSRNAFTKLLGLKGDVVSTVLRANSPVALSDQVAVQINDRISKGKVHKGPRTEDTPRDVLCIPPEFEGIISHKAWFVELKNS